MLKYLYIQYWLLGLASHIGLPQSVCTWKSENLHPSEGQKKFLSNLRKKSNKTSVSKISDQIIWCVINEICPKCHATWIASDIFFSINVLND